jgi:hypothetical protein
MIHNDGYIKNEHTGNRTLVLGPEIPCTTTMLYALVISFIHKCIKFQLKNQKSFNLLFGSR